MISLLIGTLGLVIGSFLGALSYRLPRKEDIVFDRSRCPNCKHQIAAYDNIPVISYLLLKGKCRNCKKEISIRYPLIELATAATWAIIGFNPFLLLISAILITIFIIDLEHEIIPDELVFIGLAVLAINYIWLDMPVFQFLLAGFLAADFLLFLNLITKGKGMGLGDVKLAILIGGLAGLTLAPIWIFFSFVTGAIIGIILIIFKGGSLKQKIAFGPFLIIGFVEALVFGSDFLKLLRL